MPSPAALAQAGGKVATLEHPLAAPSQAHQLAGYSPSPTSQAEVRIHHGWHSPLITAELLALTKSAGA
jgi:hypothetical protein